MYVKSKRFEILMAVILIIAVYVIVTIKLPQSKKNPNLQESTLETQTEDSEQVQKNGHCIILDAGHGGLDGGKISVNNKVEKDLNLSVVKLLKEELEQYGYEIILTRTDENGLYKESDKKKKLTDLQNRCKIIEDSNAQIVVSIHHNSYTKPEVKGAQVFYYKDDEEGRKLAKCVQNSFRENLDNTNNRVEKNNVSYYMLKYSKKPIIIAECGFLTNPEEALLVESEEYQKKVVEAIRIGIDEYFEIKRE